jgi:hypothetical protein
MRGSITTFDIDEITDGGDFEHNQKFVKVQDVCELINEISKELLPHTSVGYIGYVRIELRRMYKELTDE